MMTLYGLKLTAKQIIFYGLCLTIYLIALLLACFINPFIPFFANKEGNIPKWLSWFATPDNPIDGDSDWNKANINTKLPVGLATYLVRVKWLYRNPIYGFSTNVLGAPKSDIKPTIAVIDGFHQMGEYKDKYFMIYSMDDNKSTGRRKKVYIGWKLKSESFSKYQFVFLINPFQHF